MTPKKQAQFRLFSILVPPSDLTELVKAEINGIITHATAKDVLSEMLVSRWERVKK